MSKNLATTSLAEYGTTERSNRKALIKVASLCGSEDNIDRQKLPVARGSVCNKFNRARRSLNNPCLACQYVCRSSIRYREWRLLKARLLPHIRPTKLIDGCSDVGCTLCQSSGGDKFCLSTWTRKIAWAKIIIQDDILIVTVDDSRSLSSWRWTLKTTWVRGSELD